MAFDTYANLQAEVIDWLHRPNLSAKVPSFIKLAEAAINRKLNISPKETTAALVTVPGSRFVVRPTDMGQPLALWQDSDKLTATLVTSLDPDTDQRGAPTYWAVDGPNLALDRLADAAYPLTFRYVQDTTLSDANPTNELLRRAPDLYLYGALAQAAPYMRDDARVGLWKSEFARLLQDVHAEYSRSKSVAALATEVPTSFLSR